MLSKVKVDLNDYSYDIIISNSFIHSSFDLIRPFLKRNKVALITDENVERFHLDHFRNSLKANGIDVFSLSVSPGEISKDWNTLKRVVDWMLEVKLERDDLILAFGGGVIGDLVGFASSIVRRGIDYIQIPTSLLAQVDSSVGGKTGINSKYGKNLVGNFFHPKLVLIDVNFLNTLSHRHFLSGLGEVVKYGLLKRYSFFEWLEKNGQEILKGDIQKIIYLVTISCEIKAEIVSRDEKEKGERALLNLGHTFGHSLEAGTRYSDQLLHGEGVSIGCCLAFDLSYKLGLCSQEEPSRVRAFMKSMNMKTDISQISGKVPATDRLIELMKQDKKVKSGNLRFILPRSIGKTFIAEDVELRDVSDVINESR